MTRGLRAVVLASGALIFILALAGTVSADRCPYCGQEYGAAAPGDEARVAGLRAAHEANCPSRPTGGGGGWNTGGGNAVDWEARREAWRARADEHCDAAETACAQGDYDLAIAEASKACWMRWGWQRYTDVLNRAIALKRAQSEHDAGLVHEKLGQWGVAVVLFEAALRDHPGNAAYEASLARARAGKAVVDQDKLNIRLQALADEMSHPYPTPGLTFKGVSGMLPSIDRIEVPTPKIVPKDYVQIKVSKEWPQIPQQVVTLSNTALRALQDAYEQRHAAVKTVEEKIVAKMGGQIPGYEWVTTHADDAKELFKGMRQYTVGVYEFGMGGVEAGVRAQVRPGESWRVSDLYSARQDAAFEKTRGDVLKMASDKWKSKFNDLDWKPAGDTDLGTGPPQVMDFERLGVHPDYARVYLGARP